jgi:copper homeostasis protein (lipoprotein)
MHPPAWGHAFLCSLALGAGCTSSGAPERQPAPAPSGGVAAPATYSGRLPWPCAGCPGTDITLTLFPDSTFRLRQIYRGGPRPAAIHHLSRWSADDRAGQLVLRSRPGAPQLFQIIGADSLRLLDTLRQPIKSEVDLALVRAPKVDPVRDTMWLRGLFTYMADAGRFTECQSGATFPVAQVAANATLERRYGEARPAPGAPLLVGLRGHFEERPAMEGDRRLEYVVVDSVERVGPGATCEARMSEATLENTYWKLLQVGSEPVQVPQDAREPNLRLSSIDKQIRGATGCNSFSGHYEQSGDSLRLGPLASTLRACTDPRLNQQESVYFKALDQTRTWRVTGDTLVLSGQAGPLARFLAVYLR